MRTAVEQEADPSTFESLWRRAVAEHADRVFMVFVGADDATTEWTYAEFDDAVARTAGTLRRLGVGRGSAIHLTLTNCPAYIALWLACSRLGAWFVAGDPRATEFEIAEQLDRTRPVLGIVGRAQADAYRPASAGASVETLVLQEGDALLAPGSILLDGEPVPAGAGDPGPRDRLAVMFTSGTTSQPKGVVLTQSLYAFSGEVMGHAASLLPTDRFLVVLPLFHANAQCYCFAAAITVGASVALTSTFSASKWVGQAARLGATHGSMFAAPIRMVLAKDQSGASAKMKHVWYAQSLSTREFDDFTSRIGVKPRQLYGLTEIGPAVVTSRGPSPTGSDLGTPTPGMRLRMLRDDAPDLIGDQFTVGGVPGLTLFDGYLDDPETTARVVSEPDEDGVSWFQTGDRGDVDESGIHHFLGRSGDILKVGGENVSLTEVEAVLADYPGIIEVIAVGVPDPFLDEVVTAVVVPSPSAGPVDAEHFLAWSAQRLSPSRRPRSVLFMDELPRTAVGKIRRFLVVELARAAAGAAN